MASSIGQCSGDLTSDLPHMRSVSPFRYPGGKAFLYRLLAARLNALPEGEKTFAEPFCGGAGSAVILLKLGLVSSVHLNDMDLRVYSAWRSILDEPERFAQAIMNTPMTIERWLEHRAIVDGGAGTTFELGFSTFFLNRTSRSGIVIGSGPIGGYDQTGTWKMDARFNRSDLVERVRWLSSMKDKIKLTQEDGLTFLYRTLERLDATRTLFFVDPPYVKVGGRLYLNAMSEAKHIALSDILQSSDFPNWVLTYDDHPLIRDLYAARTIADLSVSYSLQSKRKEREVMILS